MRTTLVPCGTHFGIRITLARGATQVRMNQIRRPKPLKDAVEHSNTEDPVSDDKQTHTHMRTHTHARRHTPIQAHARTRRPIHTHARA